MVAVVGNIHTNPTSNPSPGCSHFTVHLRKVCIQLFFAQSPGAVEYNDSINVDSIKDVVRSSVKVPKFDKHLKKAGGHIDRNVMEITIKMKTIV